MAGPVHTDIVAPPNPLGEFIRLNRIGTLASAAAIAVVNLVWFGEGLLYLIPVAVLLTYGLLHVAERLLAAQRQTEALGVIAAGNWLVAIVAVSLLPWLLPVMVLTAMMPIVLATPYVERPKMWSFLIGTTLSLAAIGWLGIGRDDEGIVDDVADEIELTIVVLGMIGTAIPIGVVVWQANRYHRGQVAAATRLSEQLAESRRRMVVAGDDERARLERDLHDGAQQRLIGVAMRLRMLSSRSASIELVPVISEVEEAMADIRRLANGLSPALLESAGLEQALHAASRGLGRSVETQFDAIGRLDRTVETALYFCGLEALQNSLKHADGQRLTMSLRLVDEEVVLRVSDAGPGFDVSSIPTSNGMINMSDRMASIGGSLSVTSTPGVGTAVEATAPAQPRGLAGAISLENRVAT